MTSAAKLNEENERLRADIRKLVEELRRKSMWLEDALATMRNLYDRIRNEQTEFLLQNKPELHELYDVWKD